jgi:uncharacterized protein YndB with AHSA1/START domain
MGVVSVATSIEAPAEKVFALLADVERFPEWNRFAGEVGSFSHSPLRAMSLYTGRTGRRETKWRVTAFQPPHRMVLAGKVPMLGEVTAEAIVEWRGDYTVLVHILSFRAMPGFLRPLGLVVEKLVAEKRLRRAMEATHAAAKQRLEPVPVGG